MEGRFARGKLLRTYCMFVTLLSFYFYLTKFEPNLDMKMKAFRTFFLSSKCQYPL